MEETSFYGHGSCQTDRTGGLKARTNSNVASTSSDSGIGKEKTDISMDVEAV